MKIFLIIICLSPFHLFGVISEKVVICGVCRDVADRLPYTIEIIESIGKLFEEYQVIIYENNSLDQTVQILKEWAQNNDRVLYKTENLDEEFLSKILINQKEDGQFFRPELIARARNIVLDRAFSKQYEDYTYLIWIDMDFKIPPSLEGIVETFNSSREWDAVFAYGVDPRGVFWDWYAFRDAVSPIGSELLGNQWWYLPKDFSLNQDDDWYPVYSAFGGCGIYNKKSIEGCRYSALVTEDLVFFAKEMIENGGMSGHPHLSLYQELLNNTTSLHLIETPLPSLPKIDDPSIGIIFSPEDTLVWRMSSFVYQYPSTCEHVPLHASMIRKGYGKLYINPRLIFNYGG